MIWYRAAVLGDTTGEMIYADTWHEDLVVAAARQVDWERWLSRNPGIKGRSVIQKKTTTIEEL